MYTTTIIIISSWLIAWVAVLIGRYRQNLSLFWHEPVLKYPVMIFESDDWGPGPDVHGDILDKIIELLSKFTDSEGRHPVMTLGVILAIPNRQKIQEAEFTEYRASFLKEIQYASIKNAMIGGVDRNVFHLQLHGLEHYWPENLMAALLNGRIIDWLNSGEFPETEQLPSELQSRWIDLSTLPSSPLQQGQIELAVANEVREFFTTFGRQAKVVVPPTFVWDHNVESAWHSQCIDYLVTPGRMCNGRDKTGKPIVTGSLIYNGQQSKSGLIYVVRDEFFEPSLGHTALKVKESLKKKTRLGQPTLLEIHRFNFTQAAEQREDALKQLEQSLQIAQKAFPNLRFLSTYELAEQYARVKKSELIEKRIFIRCLVFLERLWAHQSIKKWLYISGLFIPLLALIKLRKDYE